MIRKIARLGIADLGINAGLLDIVPFRDPGFEIHDADIQQHGFRNLQRRSLELGRLRVNDFLHRASRSQDCGRCDQQ